MWERLYAISGFVRETYVVQLDADTVTVQPIPEIVEGVRNGKLAAVAWDELHQQRSAPGQAYSFRYFQQLDGSVMLPPGFTPQRVKVSLHGQDAARRRLGTRARRP